MFYFDRYDEIGVRLDGDDGVKHTFDDHGGNPGAYNNFGTYLLIPTTNHATLRMSCPEKCLGYYG